MVIDKFVERIKFHDPQKILPCSVAKDFKVLHVAIVPGNGDKRRVTYEDMTELCPLKLFWEISFSG